MEKPELHFEHKKPRFDRETCEGTWEHEIVLRNEEGEQIGGADMAYLSKPLPSYQVSSLWIDHRYQGQRYGSTLLEHVNTFLREKGKAGVLVEAIYDNLGAVGIYERHGWKLVPGTFGRYVYNLPEGFDILRFAGHEARYSTAEELRDEEEILAPWHTGTSNG